MDKNKAKIIKRDRRQGRIHRGYDPRRLSMVLDLETIVGVGVVGHFPNREQFVEEGDDQ